MDELSLYPSRRCIEDQTRNCRTSCRKYMRAECDGAPGGILDAGGVWMRNILVMKRRKEKGGVKISIDYGDLPNGVRVDEGTN